MQNAAGIQMDRKIFTTRTTTDRFFQPRPPTQLLDGQVQAEAYQEILFLYLRMVTMTGATKGIPLTTTLTP